MRFLQFMKVLKFGGTSVGTPQRIRDVATLIEDKGKNIIVLSAMSGTTNSLLEISAAAMQGKQDEIEEMIKSLHAKYATVVEELFNTEESKKDGKRLTGLFFDEITAIASRPFTADIEKEIVAFGELISTNLMTIYLREQGVNAVLLSALDYMKIDEKGEPDLSYIRSHLKEVLETNGNADLYITQGFICRDHEGKVANLQRGGSDYTASLIGAAVLAEEVQIWTDIDGMHNNDPRFVEDTAPVHNLHFEEAAELAYFGAKILHPTCILPAKENNIPVRLLNTMEPEAEGTLINNVMHHGLIKAVAAKDNITAVKIKSDRMLLAYGFLKKVFDIFAKYETPIDMLATSEVGVSLTIDNTSNLEPILQELNAYGQVTVDHDMVIICVVGDLDWQNRGFEAQALYALREIPVRMISYGGSNYNISFLVKRNDKQRALELLSETLF